MRNSMMRFVATTLVAALSLTLVGSAPSASHGMAAAGPAPVASAQQGHTSDPGLVGTGIVQKLACMACAGAFLAATGTGSIAALIVVVGLNPELATGCVVGCIAAFS